MARLGDLVTISSSSEKLKCDTFWLLNLDMVEQQTGNIIEYNYVSKDQLNGSIIQFDADVVLYSKLRPNLNKVVLPEQAGFATSEMLPLRPDSSKLLREYLAVYLRSDSFVTWAVSKTAGAKMPRLGTKELLGKEFSLPSLCEQRKIVSEFQKINKLIFLRKKQLSKLDELVKSRFIEMFGDPVSNDKGWPHQAMDKVAPSSACSGDSSERVWLLNLDMVEAQTGRIIDYLYVDKAEVGTSTCGFDEGNVLYSKLRPYLNKVVVPTKKGYCTTELVPLRPNVKLNRQFLAFLLRSDSFVSFINEKVAGAKMPRVSMNVFREFECILPPIDLQNEFATFVEQTDKAKFEIQKSLEKLETLKKALIQKYFG